MKHFPNSFCVPHSAMAITQANDTLATLQVSFQTSNIVVAAQIIHTVANSLCGHNWKHLEFLSKCSQMHLSYLSGWLLARLCLSGPDLMLIVISPAPWDYSRSYYIFQHSIQDDKYKFSTYVSTSFPFITVTVWLLSIDIHKYFTIISVWSGL